MASRDRLNPTGTQAPPKTQKASKEKGDRVIKVHKIEQRVNIPAGAVPKMPAEDSLVDWTMVEIDFTGYIGRFEGLTDILLEPKGETVNEINDQKQKYGNNINVLISFLQELISLNATARLQFRNYWQINPEFKWPNDIWKLLKTRFTEERSNILKSHLTTLTQFKFSPKEIEKQDFKGVVDRFKQAIGNVRAIDPRQVPTDEMLMTTLKGAIEDQNQFLWGLLTIDKQMTLERMLSLTSEWTIKALPQSASVANYLSLPGDLKKRRVNRIQATAAAKGNLLVPLSATRKSASPAIGQATSLLIAGIKRRRTPGLLKGRRKSASGPKNRMMIVAAASPIETRRSEAILGISHLNAMKVVVVVAITRAAATERTENQKVKIPSILGQEIAG